MIHFYDLKADTFLAYDRKAFVVKENKDIRFTLDERIRSRKERLALGEGDDGKLLLDEDMSLLEIKAPGALPLWFTDIMSELKIYSVSFSKYGRVYRQGLKEAAVSMQQECEEGYRVAIA